MLQPPEIFLLQGFSSLSFGAEPAAASDIFGPPEETQTLAEEILNNSSLVYHYWSRGYSLFFDMNRNAAFSSVETDNPDTRLFDTKIFSLTEKELIALLKSKGHALTDSEVHPWGEKRISFDSAALDCYYEKNRLVSVNFSAS